MKLFCQLIVYGIGVFHTVSLNAQLPAVQQQAIVLVRQVQKNHYNPRPVDDSLSSSIFLKFLAQLDPQQDVFTHDDYTTVAAYQYLLDDELNGGSWKFLDLVTRLYRQRLQRIDTLTAAILQKPLDFTAADNISFSKDKNIGYAPNIQELKNRWTRWFKYVLLNNAWSMAAADSTKSLFKEVLFKNETLLRDKIKKAQAKAFERILNAASFDADIQETYFNAIATSFDPHTAFFSPLQKEDFQSQLSTQEYSFGFDIDEDKEGKISVAQLTPGGPAWKTGEINASDEILQVQWKGNKPADVSAMSAAEVSDLLQQSNHDELIVKIKKPNGIVRTVTLRKEKIETEENVVKGYLLSGDKKVGYISLPDFYTTWADEKGSGCANDLAKQILLMKRENLDGLILDVRYNGGGSLSEALQLCGIFIDEGPLAGIREKDGKLVYGKDPNRGTIYDGPLVVLVNNQSASASELMAAALQDYNRAIIVGSSTYGKATMQQLFPMDSMSKSAKESPHGFVKITTGKLYRVNGLTVQLNGVIPDIILPDAFGGLELGEKFSPNALISDTVKKNNYYKPLVPLPVAALAAASSERINNNAGFQKLIQVLKAKPAGTKTIIPLKTELFEKWILEKEMRLKAMDEKEEEEHSVFTTGNYKQENEWLQHNSYAAEINAEALKSIQKDMYVQEAFRIITDMIRLQKQ